jgi:hypothetical protein
MIQNTTSSYHSEYFNDSGHQKNSSRVRWCMATKNLIPTQYNQQMTRKNVTRLDRTTQGQDQRFSLLRLLSRSPLTTMRLAAALHFLDVLFPSAEATEASCTPQRTRWQQLGHDWRHCSSASPDCLVRMSVCSLQVNIINFTCSG